MTTEERAQQFCEGAFAPLGVPSLDPYVKIITELLDGAVASERERCAKIAEGWLADCGNYNPVAVSGQAWGAGAVRDIADAIRKACCGG
jgi:hypothetical protein